MTIPRNTTGVQRLLAVMAALAGLLMIAPAAHAATLSADFGASETPKLTVGFLHNLSASAPSDELLMPAEADRWRSSEDLRARRPGAQDRSESHDRAVGPLVLPGPRVAAGRPAVDPAGGLCRMGAAVRTRYEGRGRFYWDIWNEPNFEIFWDGAREQFFETFAIAERILREELGADARIVGPSTSTWRLDWIQGRADFCLQRGCRFDAVSWHDLPDDMRSLPRLSERVESTRKLLSHPRYQPLGVREFHVNEIMGHRIQFMPGAAVGYFSELESARADVAIKSCWPDSRGRVTCEGQTLDGLLDRDTGQPRTLWYTWRA